MPVDISHLRVREILYDEDTCEPLRLISTQEEFDHYFWAWAMAVSDVYESSIDNGAKACKTRIYYYPKFSASERKRLLDMANNAMARF